MEEVEFVELCEVVVFKEEEEFAGMAARTEDEEDAGGLGFFGGEEAEKKVTGNIEN